MSRSKKTVVINVQNVPVTILNTDHQEYISLTDMAKARTDGSKRMRMTGSNWSGMPSVFLARIII